MLLAFASGTPFYMSAQQCEAFASLVLDGQAWMLSPSKGGVFDWSVTGREISRKPGVSSCGFAPALLRNVSCDRRDEWDALAMRIEGSGPPLEGHRHFFDSDYTVLRGSNWSLSVRAWSNRTVNARCINSEVRSRRCRCQNCRCHR
jgi:chondroitin AC lyase